MPMALQYGTLALQANPSTLWERARMPMAPQYGTLALRANPSTLWVRARMPVALQGDAALWALHDWVCQAMHLARPGTLRYGLSLHGFHWIQSNLQ